MKTDRRENNITKCKTKFQFCQTNGASIQGWKTYEISRDVFSISDNPATSKRQAGTQHGENGRTINSLACLLGEQYYLSLLLRRAIYKDKVKYLTDELSAENVNAKFLSQVVFPRSLLQERWHVNFAPLFFSFILFFSSFFCVAARVQPDMFMALYFQIIRIICAILT